MKKHEKDLTKFSLPALADRLHRRLCAFLVLLGLSILPLGAQSPCEPEAQFLATATYSKLKLQAAMPNLDTSTTYSWSATGLGGLTGSGTAFDIDLPTTETNFTVELSVVNDYLNANCSKVVALFTRCDTANFTYVINPDECTVSFMPTNSNVISHHWDFDDGNSSNEVAPVHLYAQTGFYAVVHTVTQLGPNGEIFVYTCLKGIWVQCNGGGSGGGTIVSSECCRLKICFTHPIQDPAATYFWDFGDGKTSTEINPCHYYDNVSTYPIDMGGTPTVVVQRCYTPPGGSQTCQNLTVNLVSNLQPAAIYVGEAGVTTSVFVVSSINGLPLFPGNSLEGPYVGPNGTVPKEVHIMGELKFNKSFDFLNFVDFCMDPCAGMVVEHHRNLIFDNNINVRNKCCLWRSIDIDHAATFTSSNENTIRGAQYGLRTKSDMTLMDISETHFDSNWVGIFLRHPLTISRFDNNTFVSDYTDTHCTPLPNIPPPSCDNEVQVMAQVPHLQRGFAGIVGKNTILNLPAGAAGNENDFTFMDNGIWLHDSDTEIRRCNFLNIVDVAYGQKSGNAIRFNVANGSHSLNQWGDNTEISQTSTGIRVETAPGGVDNSFIDSRNNDMDVSKYGYRLEIGGTLTPGSIIFNNEIQSQFIGIDATMKNAENNPTHLNINFNPITINGSGDDAIGILVKDAVPPSAATTFHDINVLENFVTLNQGKSAIEVINFRGADVAFNVLQINDASGGNAPPYPPIGIYAEGGKKNSFRCNTVTGTSSGPQHGIVTEKSYDNLISGNNFASTAVGIDFRNLCGTTTNLTCNTMQHHTYGLRYWPDAKTGDQKNKGNQWLGTWPNPQTVAAWHMGQSGNDLNDCRFKAAIGTNQWPPSIQAPFSTIPWFTNGNFVTCNTGCDWMLQPDSTNDMDLTIATTGFNMPTNNDVYNWDARRYLYNKLTANPALANQSATYTDFQSNQAGTSMGLLHSAVEQTHGLFAIPVASQQVLDANFVAIQAARSAISTIDATIAASGLTESQLTNLLTDKETQTANLATLQASTEQLQAQLLANRASAANSIIAFNSSITTNAVHDQNEKTLLGIYLNTSVKNLPLTLVQKAQVLAIAQQCPESGGYSTYWARAWYSALTGTMVVPEDCLYLEDRSNEGMRLETDKTLGDDLFTLSPNPAQDFITLTLNPQAIAEGASICLMDLSGKTMLEQQLENGTTEATLSVQNIPNGIYLIGLRLGGEEQVVQKLAIIR